MKGHFISNTPNGFDWDGFQKHMGYTDDELNAIKADPKRSEFVQKICTKEFQNKCLVAEVVASHGCIAGLERGDRIVYRGLTALAPEYSTAWCPYITNAYWFANNARIFINSGLDPNVSYVPFSGCMDVGPENGLGRTIFKTYVIEESELEKVK